jgi:hypothetical protein
MWEAKNRIEKIKIRREIKENPYHRKQLVRKNTSESCSHSPAQIPPFGE